MRKPSDEKNRRLLAKIDEYQRIYGLKDADLAKAIDRSDRTLRNRRTNADEMTLGELRAIVRRLNIPMAEIVPYI